LVIFQADISIFGPLFGAIKFGFNGNLWEFDRELIARVTFLAFGGIEQRIEGDVKWN
jgi:hypothetical protein